MSLAIGQRLGRFEVLAPLGTGGMGEVYRARDTKLERDVALKVLPEAVSESADRRARFAREARVLAALNHPAIASLYEVQEHGASDVLVMELVDGETLADRLTRGALPIPRALDVARRIAEALEGAHDRGILHRDLKPANIMLTPTGEVKLVDFGLAAALDAPVEPEAFTLTRPQQLGDTAPGSAPGTVPYMSPEQTRGEDLDRRTDVWAFGCVLYEMLAGRRAFSGPTRSDVMAAVVAHEPDWGKLPSATPVKVQDLVHRCLQKDRSRRLRDIGDARLELQEALEESEIGRPLGQPPRRTRGVPGRWMAGAATLAAVGALALWGWRAWPRTATLPKRISLTVPAGVLVTLRSVTQALALSPDGRSLAYEAWSRDKVRILVQTLEETAPRPILEDASDPFFSPDGRWLGFLQGGELRKMALAGGVATIICPLADARGLTWSSNDQIFFTPNSQSGLWSVSASGGKPQLLTTPDSKLDQISHRWPQALPDGQHVLFTILPRSLMEDDGKLAVLSLATRQWKVVLEGSLLGRYLPSGHLLYRRLGSLHAAAFDIDHLRVVGPRIEVLTDVSMATGGGGQTLVASSAVGLLAYVPGDSKPIPRSLLWVDRSGRATPVTTRRLPYSSAALSPDGRSIAVEVEDVETQHLELLDVARDAWRPLVPEFRNSNEPAFSPDGRWIAFSSYGKNQYGIFKVTVEGGPAERIVSPAGGVFHLGGWSPDGRRLIFAQQDPESWDLWTVQVDGDPNPRALLKTPDDELNPCISPDGRYVAYTLDGEVSIRPSSGSGPSRQVSAGGGADVRWSRGGRELFYRSFTKPPKMMSARISTHPTLTVESPRAVFDDTFLRPATRNVLMTAFDVTADGQRFLMIEQTEEPEPPRQIVVIPNFADEVREKLRAVSQ